MEGLSLWRKSLGLLLPLLMQLPAICFVNAAMPLCASDEDCETALLKGSVCRLGTCTNPYYEQGCLATAFAERGQDFTHWKRVCNSEDSPQVLTEGYCTPPVEALQYAEIRIATQNWESAYIEAWMLQILLQEVLGVPATLETGSPDVNLDFYDPNMSFGWGTSNDWPMIENSVQIHADCRNIPRTAGDGSYQPCAHVMTEVWATQSHTMERLVELNTIESPLGLGMIGQQAWFLPRFVAEADPTLLTHFGLAGEENRRKLADTFLRPTRWGEYCTQESESNCTIPDGVASRPPYDDAEAAMYFASPETFTGYFRKTAENDCDNYPATCTGHIADYPCGWSSFVEQQAFHLDIHLRSSGTAPGCRGYEYGELTQIAAASNATKSPIIIQWWVPEATYQSYRKSYMEFLPITMPPATQECMDATVTPEERCHPEKEVRVGDADGACAEPPYPLQKVLSGSLYDITEHPSIPEAQRNPAYEVVKTFSLSALEMGQLFDAWLTARSPSGSGLTLRHATCEWMVDNWDKVSAWIPRTYPRVAEKSKGITEEPLGLTTVICAFVTIVAVLATCLTTYSQRQRPVIRYAQIGFLYIILGGLFLVSIGSLISLADPSTATCVSTIWLINVGFTLEITPLIVKVGAIQRLLQAARQARRVKLDMQTLYGVVVGITSFVIAFLLLWSVLDTPTAEESHMLSSQQTNDGETIVWISDYCTSDTDTWRYLVALWHSLLLIAASVLAFTTRKIKTDFNENSTLTLMVYSHVIFVLLRVLSYTLDFGEGGETDAVLYRSLVFSADTLVTILIYFVSKFISKDEPNAGVVDLRTSQLSSSVLTRDGVKHAALVNWAGTGGGGAFPLSGSYHKRTNKKSVHREKVESAVFPSIMEVEEEASSSSMEEVRNSDKKCTTGESTPESLSTRTNEEEGGLRCRHCGSQVVRTTEEE